MGNTNVPTRPVGICTTQKVVSTSSSSSLLDKGPRERTNRRGLRKFVSALSALSLVLGFKEGSYCHFIPEHFICNAFLLDYQFSYIVHLHIRRF